MAEKARSAVASYFSSHENSDGTDVNKWSVSEDDTGSKREYGNPARDPFVRQFMRGLKKKKSLEYVPARAVPISLQMLDVLHKFMVSAQDGFTEDCQMWFKAVSSFAFDGMCRINEVLTLKWKDVSLRQFRANVLAPDEIIEFGTYTHFNRKIEVEEGRSYNLHKLAGEETAMNAYEYLSNWVAYATEKRGHKWVDEDYVFPVLVGLSKKAIKSGKGSTGCEKVTVGWGKKMGEQSFINLLNCIVHSLNGQGQSTPGYVAKQWYNSWFTSHTFRRAGDQYRFMYAKPARRWSLRMIKWWAGWSVSESTETLVRYILDLTIQTEESELADCFAPGKSYLHGCSSAPYEASKNTEEGPVIKRLRQLETLLLETKAQITELKNLQSQAGLTDQSVARLPAINVTDAAAASNLETQLRSQTNELDIPSVKDWAHLWLLWWLPHEKVHLFKPLSEWSQSDRARTGITRSWYSVAKLLGEDLAMFANMMGESDKCRWHKTVLPLFSSYYVKYYGGAGSADRDTTFTISMLASFIRKDRKGRRNSACPAKPLPDYSSYL